ncbi:MAG: TrkA C-terminal domain-containing protein [Nitriliruptor sp.]|uniref:TrkA C-terminal domain-containing protein n=1 Tax=Nitriliruptor sp. TaxID=2448056 RepID=UPI0034A01311
MSIPIAPIITVLIVIVLSMLVGRVATIALTLTGMSREAARFQARSALTGAGYTTTESESVVNHPLRRRIVMTLMLIGSAGIVTVLASVMLTLVRAGSSETGNSTLTLLALVVGTVGLLLLMKLQPVDRAVSRVIRLGLRRFTDLDVRDYAALLEVHGGYAVSELQVDGQDWMADHTLRELRLNEEGVLVLGVQRVDGQYDGAPDGDTRIQPGDVLVIYGHGDRIADLDVRERGWSGDVSHLRATREHASRVDVEEDPAHDVPDEADR